MKLCLLRHGSAEYGVPDETRRLSAAGEQEVCQIAQRLSSYQLNITQIMHSPLIRAKQTAQIIDQKLQLGKILHQEDQTLPMSDVRPFANLLEPLKTQQSDIMLVSHLPFIPTLICYLCELKLSQLVFPITPASCTILTYEMKIGWQLHSYLSVG